MAGRTRSSSRIAGSEPLTPINENTPGTKRRSSVFKSAAKYLSNLQCASPQAKEEAENVCPRTNKRPASAPPERPRSAAPASKRLKEAHECKKRVQVVVRIRPLSNGETDSQDFPCVETLGDTEVYLQEVGSAKDVLRQHRLRNRQFAFDAAFGGEGTQEQVYEASAKMLVESVLEGRGNATCFCYGATGTGKTHTMLGSKQDPGIMVLSLRDIFQHVNDGSDLEVSMSYLEVYNEQVRDLLNPTPKKTLDLREETRGPTTGVVVAGLTRANARSTHAVMELLQRANTHRTTEPTRANATSSRSHAILQVFVTRVSEGTVSKLSLIDLAGSERALATDARTKRSAEGAAINKSLLALCECINALVQGRKHVPYRNSKLTLLLKDSLNGSCRTAMIANVSPATASFGESGNTLAWADRAKEIKTSSVAPTPRPSPPRPPGMSSTVPPTAPPPTRTMSSRRISVDVADPPLRCATAPSAPSAKTAPPLSASRSTLGRLVPSLIKTRSKAAARVGTTDRAGGARAIAELQAENDKLQRQLAEIQAAEERKEAKETADQIEFGDKIDAEAATKLEADEAKNADVLELVKAKERTIAALQLQVLDWMQRASKAERVVAASRRQSQDLPRQSQELPSGAFAASSSGALPGPLTDLRLSADAGGRAGPFRMSTVDLNASVATTCSNNDDERVRSEDEDDVQMMSP